jgi:hypothetical protein
MEIHKYRGEKILPFNFSYKLSVKDINKKFRIMAKSSEVYNNYINNFYQLPCQTETCHTDRNEYYKPYESIQSQKNHSVESRKYLATEGNSNYSKYSANSNFSYMELNYNNRCSNLNKNLIIKNSKIKLNKIFPNYNKIPKISELPRILNNNEKKRMVLKTSTALMNNAFEIFYPNVKFSKEIIFSAEDYKLNSTTLNQLILDSINNSKVVSGIILLKSMDHNSEIPANSYQKIFNKDTGNEIRLTFKFPYFDINGVGGSKAQIYFPVKYLPLLLLLDNQQRIEFFLYVLKFDAINKNFSIDGQNLSLAFNNFEIFNNFHKIRKLFKLKDSIAFNWLTPDNIYSITFELPIIEFYFKSTQSLLNKLVDEDLLFFILHQNFINWDFYIINNLILKKSFRVILNKVHTNFKNTSLNKLEERNIFTNCIDLDKEFGHEKSTYSQSLEDKFLLLGFSYKENKTYKVKIQSYSVEILMNKTNQKEIFYFSLRHSLRLYKLSQIVKLNLFLRKVFYLDKNELIVKDLEILDNFNEDYMEITKKYALNRYDSKYDPRGLILLLK